MQKKCCPQESGITFGAKEGLKHRIKKKTGRGLSGGGTKNGEKNSR